MVKTPKGELSGAEIRKLIRAHNILVSIKIPVGTDREGLIKLIEGKGYKVDHKKKAIIDAKKDRPRRPKVTLEEAKELTKPKPLTEEQKKKRQQSKQKKAGEKAFLKTVIPKPPPVSKPSKGVKVGKPPPKKKESKKEQPKDEIKKVFIDVMEEYEDYKGDLVKETQGEDRKKHKAELTIVRNIIKSIKADKKFTQKQLPLVRKGINYYVRELVDKDNLDKEDDPVIFKYGKIALDLQKKYK